MKDSATFVVAQAFAAGKRLVMLLLPESRPVAVRAVTPTEQLSFAEHALKYDFLCKFDL